MMMTRVLVVFALAAVVLAQEEEMAVDPIRVPASHDENMQPTPGNLYEVRYYPEGWGHMQFNYIWDGESQDQGWNIVFDSISESWGGWQPIEDTEARPDKVGPNRRVLASEMTWSRPTNSSFEQIMDITVAADNYNNNLRAESNNVDRNMTFTLEHLFEIVQPEDSESEMLWEPWHVVHAEVKWRMRILNYQLMSEWDQRSIRTLIKLEPFNHEEPVQWLNSDCPNGGGCTITLNPFIDWEAIDEQNRSDGPPDPSTIGEEEDPINWGVGPLQMRAPGKAETEDGELKLETVQWEEDFEDDMGRFLRQYSAFQSTSDQDADNIYLPYQSYEYMMKLTVFSGASAAAASAVLIFLSAALAMFLL